MTVTRGDVLRFAFMPQIGPALRAAADMLAVFVGLIAQVLASVHLLPQTHPAVRGERAALTIDGFGRAMIDASANIRWGWQAVPQLAVFYAIFGMVICIVVSLTLSAMDLFISVAAAQQEIQNAAEGASTDLFYYENDQGRQWLESIFLLAGGQAGDMPIAAALGPMLQTYSYGALVLAGIILGYSVISMVVQTAHQGVIMGQQHNEVWGPIRLVFALGLLVPLGSGFNTGQMVVVQFAQWGSGLASNAWQTFVQELVQEQEMVPSPSVPNVQGIVRSVILLETCSFAVKEVNSPSKFDNPIDIQVMGATMDGSNRPYYYRYDRVAKYQYGTRRGQVSNRQNNYCGSVFIPPDNTVADLEKPSSISSARLETAARRAHTQALYQLLTDAKRTDCGTDGEKCVAYALARRAVHTDQDFEAPTSAGLAWLEERYVDNLSQSFEREISAAVDDAVNNVSSEAIAERGWVAAGSWFFDVARLNNRMVSVTGNLPTVETRIDILEDEANNVFTQTWKGVSGFFSGLGSFFGLASESEPKRDEEYYVTAALGMADRWYTNTATLGGGAQEADQAEPSGGSGYWQRLGSLLSIQSLIAQFKEESADRGDSDLPTNALVTMVQFGNGLRDVGLTMWAIGGVVELGSGIAGILPSSATQAAGKVGGALGGLIKVIGVVMLTAGLALSLVLPMLPAIRFVFGIMTWLLSIVEAIVALPILALAHLRTDGEGLMGPMAQSGYLLLLQLFVRPILMVLGLIGGLLIFTVGISALNIGMLEVVDITSSEGFSLRDLIGNAAYVVVYFVVALAMANMAFKAIDMVPDQVMRWIGGPQTASLSTQDSLQRGTQTFGQYEGRAAGARLGGIGGAGGAAAGGAANTISGR